VCFRSILKTKPDEMRFQLTFDGDLPSVGNSPPPRRPAKVAVIWTLRHAISAQLESLWEHHHLLRGVGGTQARAAANTLRQPIKRCGHEFVAIVRPALKLKCELCVNMLVNHSLGSLVTGIGDLDNRVKTLLDALRVPKDPQEFKHVTLAPGLYPCLLEDDAMITALHITTDRYLACPSTSPQHVRLQISVSVLPAENDFSNEAFRTD
jgi:hypothetical protein